MAKRTVVVLAVAAVVAVPLVGSSQSAGEYVGLETCAACHADINDSFANTAHAKALGVLKDAGSDGDPECLACHTTGLSGAKYVDGAVTCEACHGPGGEHVASGDPAAVAKGGGEAVCLKCHTPDWSPDFDYEAYLAKGVHGE